MLPMKRWQQAFPYVEPLPSDPASSSSFPAWSTWDDIHATLLEQAVPGEAQEDLQEAVVEREDQPSAASNQHRIHHQVHTCFGRRVRIQFH
jgi:hypothetical protein